MENSIDFIGIGCPKSGTTKIAALLRDHPEICFSEPKSLRYFNKLNSYYQGFDNPIYNRGIENYLKHFNHRKSETICGEFTTVYLYEAEAARLIEKLFPDVKLIVCLRDPVDRIVSHYNWLKYFLKVEDREFSALIREEFELIDKSLYAKHLTKYYEHFERDNIKVIFLNEFVENSKKVIGDLYHYLDVDANFIPKDLTKKENSRRITRSVFLSKVYGRFVEVMVNSGNSWVVDSLRKTPLRTVYQKINSSKIKEKIQPSKEDLQYLTSHILPDIIQLEQLLKTDLTKWKSKLLNQ